MKINIDPLFVLSFPIMIYVLSTFIFPYYYKNEDSTIYLLLTFAVLSVISVSILVHELPTLIYCRLKGIKCIIRFFPFFSLKKINCLIKSKTRIIIDISSFLSLAFFTSTLFLLLNLNSFFSVPWWITSTLDVSFKILFILMVYHLIPIFPSDSWYILFSIFNNFFKQKSDSFNFLFKVSLTIESILIIISIGTLLYGYFLQGFLMVMFTVYLRYFTLKHIYNEIDFFDLLFTDIGTEALIRIHNIFERNDQPGIFSKSVFSFSIHYTNSPTNRVSNHTILHQGAHNTLLQQVDNDTKLKLLKTMTNELEIK